MQNEEADRTRREFMPNRMERFFTEFNSLHDSLQDYSNSTADFFTLLKELENHPVINRYKDELHIIRKLRNLLVHEKTTIDYDVAMPSEKTVEQLAFIREQFVQPTTAGEHFSRKVFCFNRSDSLERLLYFVGVKSLYQFPIFDANGLAGIISHSGITNWLAHHYSDGVIDLSHVIIADIISDENSFFQYEVVPTDTSLFHIEKMFTRNLLVGRSQYIILLSDKKQIKEWEDLKGIITPWDLPEVLSLIQYEY